jgi:uncharacterized protein
MYEGSGLYFPVIYNIFNMKEIIKQPIVAGAAVLAIAVIFAVSIASYTAYGIRAMDNMLSVTGSAKQSVVADQVKWTVNFSRPVTTGTIKEGYASIDRDFKIMRAFFLKNGFSEQAIITTPVFMEEVYENNSPSPEFKKYTLRQSVTVSSTDIERVSLLSKNTKEIIDQGVILSALSPEYSISNLSALRVSLLAEALKDAKARAESIVKVSGSGVGKLKSATGGVVQVLPQGSNEVSDYGTYDTTNIQKEVMVTVRASFAIK